MSTKRIKAALVAMGIGMVEGAIGNLVIKKHLEKEGWKYNKESGQFTIEESGFGAPVVVAMKEMEAEQYKNTVYAVVGVTAFITGLVIRKVVK